MSESRTTIPEWELMRLRAITDAPTVQQREAALMDYLNERERRKRYSRVRNARDRQRRTLVGAHVPMEEAERVAILARAAGMSTTAFVKRAIELNAMRVTQEAQGQQTTDYERRIARGQNPASWAVTVRRP